MRQSFFELCNTAKPVISSPNNFSLKLIFVPNTHQISSFETFENSWAFSFAVEHQSSVKANLKFFCFLEKENLFVVLNVVPQVLRFPLGLVILVNVHFYKFSTENPLQLFPLSFEYKFREQEVFAFPNLLYFLVKLLEIVFVVLLACFFKLSPISFNSSVSSSLNSIFFL